MKIDEEYYTCDLEHILDELINQMRVNNYPYLQKGYKRSGDSLQVQCPFHGDGQERKPSFGIRRSDGMGHCFACGQVVTLPEFITKCFDENDIIAEFGRRWLRKNFLSLEVEERKDVELDCSRNSIIHHSGISNKGAGRTGSSDARHSLYVDEAELDTYRYYHRYWKERGITDEGIIELFDLGYDSRTMCITMPVRDLGGDCLFVARRSVNTKWFNYPEGVEKPLYGLYELEQFRESNIDDIFICESMIDCLLLWQAGFYALALNGTGNKLQMKQLRKIHCRHFILATDNDEAGEKARERLRKALPNKIISEIRFPKGVKDIGELPVNAIENIKKFEKF